VRLEPEPPRLGTDPPPKNPTEPEAPRLGTDPPPKNPTEPDGPGPLKPETPAKPPPEIQPGASCSLKRGGPCRPGAKTELGIDADYDRTVDPIPDGYTTDYLQKAGIEKKGGSKWFESKISNGPDAKETFQKTVIDDIYDKNYNPKNSKDKRFEGLYDEFIAREKDSYGVPDFPGYNQPFVKTKNNHGENPTMVVEEMHKNLDLYSGCKNCEFVSLGENTWEKKVVFDRPAITKPGGTQVFTSQQLADNWRVSAIAAKADPKKIDNFAMNNVATPESQTIFNGLFKTGETDKTFARGTPEFDLIEGTPTKKGTVQADVIRRMLEGEKDTFGNKIITEHRIFKEGSTWNMISKTGEGPA
jgi:hypothetical protein